MPSTRLLGCLDLSFERALRYGHPIDDLNKQFRSQDLGNLSKRSRLRAGFTMFSGMSRRRKLILAVHKALVFDAELGAIVVTKYLFGIHGESPGDTNVI